jgi:16S rRNA (guanine527-N7)-methyltransferase
MEHLEAGVAKLGLLLSSNQLRQFHNYYKELISWNDRINLTSITGFRDVQIKHFLDSLTIINALKQLDGKQLRIIDIGTGAGFPGLPIKIALPDIELVLLEATTKKASFLRHLKAALELEEVDIVAGRAEDIAHQEQYHQKFDIVLSRAVAPLATLAELSLPLCAVGGRLIAQKKGAIDWEVARASRVIKLLGGDQPEIKRIKLAEFGEERCLVIIEKIAPSPQKYPRRPGMPAKRPIV